MKHSCGTALDSRGARLRSNPTPGIYRNGRVLPRCLTFRVRLDFVFIADTTGTRTMTCGTGTTRGPRPPPRRRRRTGNSVPNGHGGGAFLSSVPAALSPHERKQWPTRDHVDRSVSIRLESYLRTLVSNAVVRQIT